MGLEPWGQVSGEAAGAGGHTGQGSRGPGPRPEAGDQPEGQSPVALTGQLALSWDRGGGPCQLSALGARSGVEDGGWLEAAPSRLLTRESAPQLLSSSPLPPPKAQPHVSKPSFELSLFFGRCRRASHASSYIIKNLTMASAQTAGPPPGERRGTRPALPNPRAPSCIGRYFWGSFECCICILGSLARGGVVMERE